MLREREAMAAMTGGPIAIMDGGLEGRLFGETFAAAARRRSRTPGIVIGGARPGGPGAGRTSAGRTEAGARGTALGAIDLGRGVLERRADLVDVELDNGCLLYTSDAADEE